MDSALYLEKRICKVIHRYSQSIGWLFKITILKTSLVYLVAQPRAKSAICLVSPVGIVHKLQVRLEIALSTTATLLDSMLNKQWKMGP